ncbi:MFS transporter [Achromobacter sp. Marseille-Q4962]|uniref:MFS transporter n=1 Tax=Achromobacter sp. Marseille-Q4962 TaxID=2942202 RepID=UPI002072AD35|nr:MFS transporter [Achromobacter sp. Marseille-Q4962]
MTMAYEGAAATAAGQAQRRRTRRVVMASIAGNAMEWYDFFIYGTAAALVFGELFFPKGTDPLLGTMGAFAGFAVGFLARPLGGVVFGHIGDRRGRKIALEWTLGIMGASTFLIGLLPTYAQAGFWAPAAMVLLRILQGAAAGGEWGGGVLLISEAVEGRRRGFFSSFSQLGVAGGFVLSSAVFMLAQQLPRDAFMSWGWRLPFLLSVFIFGIGLYIRRHIPESEAFVQARKTARRGMPAVEVFRRYPREVFTAMGLRVAENGGSYIFLAFALAYGKFLGISSDLMLGGVLLSMFVELGTLVWFGHLSDRIGRRAVYLLGSAGLMAAAFPFFWMVETREPFWIFAAFLLGNTVCHAAMIGTQPSYFAELFPPEVRYTGLALGHELASVFAGGLSPLIAMALLRKYESATPVAWFLVGLAAITVITLLLTREPARRDRA